MLTGSPPKSPQSGDNENEENGKLQESRSNSVARNKDDKSRSQSKQKSKSRSKSKRRSNSKSISKSRSKSKSKSRERSSKKKKSSRKRSYSRSRSVDDDQNAVYVNNLSGQTSDRKLTKKMEKYGKVSECKIIRERSTGVSKKYGFVYFKKQADQEYAADKKVVEIDGKQVNIEIARRPKPRPQTPGKYLGRNSGSRYAPSYRDRRSRSRSPRRHKHSSRRSRRSRSKSKRSDSRSRDRKEKSKKSRKDSKSRSRSRSK